MFDHFLLWIPVEQERRDINNFSSCLSTGASAEFVSQTIASKADLVFSFKTYVFHLNSSTDQPVFGSG